jgi:ABC-2 type transport system ATP-binding protein
MIDAAGLAWRSTDGAMARAAAVRVIAGEIAALDDPASAGALLRVLATLVRPLEGRLTIDGIDALHAPMEARRRLVYVSPELPLPEALTVAEYLAFLADARRQPRDAARHAADRFDLNPRLLLCRLTRDQRQRARLAGAAATGSRVILLHDPGHGLDDAAGRMLAEWVLQASSLGAAVVLAGAGALAGLPVRAIAWGKAVA